MPGAHIQLATAAILEIKDKKTGKKKKNLQQQDNYLTENPTLNFFNLSYKRYQNFAQEIFVYRSKSTPKFGGNLEFLLSSSCGDYLSDVHLYVKLPALTATSGTYAAWTQSVGFALFEYVEIRIAGQPAQRLYSVWEEINDELTTPAEKRDARNLLIGKYYSLIQLQSNATSETEYHIPLSFFFCKELKRALPLFLMRNCTIEFIFKLRDFSEIITYDGITPPNDVQIIDAYLETTQYIIDPNILEIEYKKIEKTGKAILIEQIQYNDDQMIPANRTAAKLPLVFNNPLKEIIFVLVDDNSEQNNDWFNFSRYSDGNKPILKANLLIDGKERFSSDILEDWFRLIAPLRHHTKATNKYIYVMPLSEFPEEYQPSGSLNASCIDELILYLTMNTGNNAMHVYSFARSLQMMLFDGDDNMAISWMS